jgi:hypothetical protein
LYNSINYNWEKINRYKIFGKPHKTIDLIGKKRIEEIEEFFKESNNKIYNEIGLKSIKKHGYPM